MVVLINSRGDYQQQPTLQIFFQFWVAKTIRKKTEKNLQLQLVEGCPSTLRPKNPCQWAPPVALNQEGDPVHFWVADMETLKFEDVLILVTIPMILPMKTHESRTCPCFFCFFFLRQSMVSCFGKRYPQQKTQSFTTSHQWTRIGRAKETMGKRQRLQRSSLSENHL